MSRSLLAMCVALVACVVACSSGSSSNAAGDGSCSQSAAAWCASTGGAWSCDQTFGQARARWASSCSISNGALLPSCNGYAEEELGTPGSTVREYFDESSGALVAVVYDNGSTYCLGGPSGFSPPSCPDATFAPCVVVDGGSGADVDAPDQ